MVGRTLLINKTFPIGASLCGSFAYQFMKFMLLFSPWLDFILYLLFSCWLPFLSLHFFSLYLHKTIIYMKWVEKKKIRLWELIYQNKTVLRQLLTWEILVVVWNWMGGFSWWWSCLYYDIQLGIRIVLQRMLFETILYLKREVFNSFYTND